MQQKYDDIILIAFVGYDNYCKIDWIYFERKYIDEPEMLNWYKNVGMYNGLVDRKLFNELCEKLLDN